MSSAINYLSYPVPNSVLIKELRLIRHPEGGTFSYAYMNSASDDSGFVTLGYFAETDRQQDQIPSPFANQAPRSLATTIYYLLTPDEPNGVIHMNKSATMHVHHQGRAEYTLITPGSPPTIERKIIGPNIHAGEVLQLLVPTGVWKMSRLLDEDLAKASTEDAKELCGCLITEVVFPGFAWEDHSFLTQQEFEKMWDHENVEEAKELAKYVRRANA